MAKERQRFHEKRRNSYLTPNEIIYSNIQQVTIQNNLEQVYTWLWVIGDFCLEKEEGVHLEMVGGKQWKTESFTFFLIMIFKVFVTLNFKIIPCGAFLKCIFCIFWDLTSWASIEWSVLHSETSYFSLFKCRVCWAGRYTMLLNKNLLLKTWLILCCKIFWLLLVGWREGELDDSKPVGGF